MARVSRVNSRETSGLVRVTTANVSAAGRTDVYEKKNEPAPHGAHRGKTVREGTMVVRSKMVESHTLKFGMDRILSEDLSSANTRLEVPCMSAPPCAGCISSLYRCCRASPILADTNFYRGIHAPQPLRPYTNGETNLHQNGQNGTGISPKRKRSWSRAVFSNLQRKGLEKRFQLQKYITKPDRRQLAATLGLTDAQVKVWFQNRRMKWRHTKESSRPPMKETTENILVSADSTQSQNADSECEAEIDVQTCRPPTVQLRNEGGGIGIPSAETIQKLFETSVSSTPDTVSNCSINLPF